MPTADGQATSVVHHLSYEPLYYEYQSAVLAATWHQLLRENSATPARPNRFVQLAFQPKIAAGTA